MAYMNPLETEEDMEKYKEWLASKHKYFIKCLLSNFERDRVRDQPKYVKLHLRIELATQELSKRDQ